MKVVKCEKHIPENFLGRVVVDGITIGGNFFPTLKDSDYFPLPEQGDMVSVTNFRTFTKPIYEFVEYYERYKEFIVKIDDCYYGFKYIRPIEKEEYDSVLSLDYDVKDIDMILLNGKKYIPMEK